MFGKKCLVFLFLLAIPLLAFSTTFQRTVSNRIEIQPDGSAVIVRTEKVPQSELSKIYILHYEEMAKDKTVFNQFVSEISKDYYFLYGTAPSFTNKDVKVTVDGKNFLCTIKMVASGIIRKSDDGYLFSRKRMQDEKANISEKLFTKYFENELDGKFFESGFLQSEKNMLHTERTTDIVLPQESTPKELKPVFEKESTNDWSVEFGGGSHYRATLEKTKEGFLIKEDILTSGAEPKALMDEKNNGQVIKDLRDYTAFDVIFDNEGMSELTQPVPHKVKDDYSGNWSYSVSSGEALSHTFTYQTLSVQPGVTLTLSFSASLLWEHHWVRTGWCTWKYKLNKFQTTLSFSPSITPFVNVTSGANITKTWSTNLFTRSKPVTFWISCVPVVLYLQAKLDAEAVAEIYGSMGFNLSATFTMNTSLTVKYQNGWSTTPSYSANYSGVNFSANAKIGANAKGSLPFTLAAYVYNVAGPFVTLTPWIKGDVNAGVGSSNQVGYTVTGGLNAKGGVQMAGWLKGLCDGIPTASYDFWNKEWTLRTGTYTF